MAQVFHFVREGCDGGIFRLRLQEAENTLMRINIVLIMIDIFLLSCCLRKSFQQTQPLLKSGEKGTRREKFYRLKLNAKS